MENLTVTKDVEIKNAIKLDDNHYLKIYQDGDAILRNDDDGRIAKIVYKGSSRYTLSDTPNNYDTYAENHYEAMLYYFAGKYMNKDTDQYFTAKQFQAIENWVEKNVIYKPVHAYVQSSTTISVNRNSIPNCRFDSGQSGFVYITKQKIREVRCIKRVTKKVLDEEIKFMEGYVEYFDDLLQGNVYGFEIVDENDNHVDSCYGFVGDLSGDNALNMAQHMNVDIDDQKIVEAIEYIGENNLIIY